MRQRGIVAGGSGDSLSTREDLTHAKSGGQPSHNFYAAAHISRYLMIPGRSLTASLCLSALLGFGAAASGQSAVSDSASARTFVESFYRWYVPIAMSDLRGPADVLALKQSRLYSARS